MQAVQRKSKKSRPHLRWVWLILALAVLAGGLTGWLLAQKTPEEPAEHPAEKGLLADYEDSQVRRVEVTFRGGDTWVMTADEAGACLVEAEGQRFEPDRAMARLVIASLGVVEYQEKLTDRLAQTADPTDMELFGLQPPRETVTVSYADGGRLTLYIGEKNADMDVPFYYLQVEGDPALYALDISTAQDLFVTAGMLRPVPQPEIQAARIDRISFRTQEGGCSWELAGEITDPDAADRWQLVEPFVYSAEGEAVANLRKNLVNLRVGGYVAEATPEELAKYGFDQPRAVITVHMAEGTTLVTDEAGSAAERDWPEETLTFTVGSARNELVDYVCFRDTICTVSRFMVSAVTDTVPLDTLTRYPVRTSLSNLKRLTVETAGGRDVYEVTRVEQVAENNELVLDDAGVPVTDNSVTRNGRPADWSAFQQCYGQLLLVTVSGVLPEGWQGEENQCHTRLVFETETGISHAIGLSDFDAFHDAVWVDGHAVFYLVKGGLSLTLPDEAAE